MISLFGSYIRSAIHPAITAFVLLCAFFLSACPGVEAALEKSSKKACAMCHVMWLDEFRSEQETLIEWQPGNVLMKDTQGIVSSEEICYSCHDGYVSDSRHTAWKHNNHTTFEKPSEKIRMPEKLTLSNKDEIYCGTCHTPHSVQGSETEVLESIAGPLSFLRIDNTDSALCEACHVNEADYERTKGHPLHTDEMEIPRELFEQGAVKAGKADTLICQTCHRVHGADGRNLTVMDNSRSRLCRLCHEQRTIVDTQHDLGVTMPNETNIKGQSAAESGPCGACHVPHDSAGYKLWAREMPPGNPASRICLSCHDEKPSREQPLPAVGPVEADKDGIKGIGRFSHPNDIAPVSAEDKQAGRARLTENLPFFSRQGEREPGGKIECFTCHNIHQWDPADPGNRGKKEVEGDASNSFLRISSSRSSAICVECHRDQQSVLLYDHNLVLTAPEAKNSQGYTAAESGPCGACHIPHNAADKRLWAGNPARDLVPNKSYCKGCHDQSGPAKEKRVGENDHPVHVASKGDHIPGPARIARTLPLFNARGGSEDGENIRCRTCHDPHIWSPVNLETQAPPSYPKDARAENREGTAATSFLRKTASPAPDLCAVCHEEAALVVGTDHDLFVTAPEAENEMGQTVAESGQCGACHAVHNSPEKRLLWAGGRGPAGEDEHPMNSLCTSCHSENGSAEEKIPPVATHPQEQLINNIIRFDNQPTGYIKIFNSDWEETRVGDLSCSSCHSFARWDHRVRQQGPGTNVEGNASTSFLRAPSDHTVCIDCHGETAIWRYSYFHSEEKREMLKHRKP